MARYIVIGQAEYYTYVEADSPEAAEKAAQNQPRWFRTMNQPIQNPKATEVPSGLSRVDGEVG